MTKLLYYKCKFSFIQPLIAWMQNHCKPYIKIKVNELSFFFLITILLFVAQLHILTISNFLVNILFLPVKQ